MNRSAAPQRRLSGSQFARLEVLLLADGCLSREGIFQSLLLDRIAP